MQNRVCDNCGKEFLWRSLDEAVSRTVSAVIAWLVALFGIGTIGGWLGHGTLGGWAGFFAGMFIFVKIEESLARSSRKCPSCGSGGVDVQSPLGQELKERWKGAKAEEAKKATDQLRQFAGYQTLREVESWIAAGADVNVTSKDGWTPLMMAACHALPRVAKALAKAGANVNVKNAVGQTALILSINGRWRAPAVTSLLISWGADVNAQDNEGRTALDHAIELRNAKAVTILMNAKAKRNANLAVS